MTFTLGSQTKLDFNALAGARLPVCLSGELFWTPKSPFINFWGIDMTITGTSVIK
jgi:hypothetical protein